MKFAHFFIERPVFAAVLSIVTIVVGALSYLGLPKAQYPEIAPPTVTVACAYPGANAETIAETVATPIEQQINGVENMIYMSSQSTSDGNMHLTITFKLGTNLDIAQVQVQNRVAIAQPVLPQEVQRQGIVVKKATPDITLAVALFSPDHSRDTLYLSNYATLHIRDELARLPGVGDLTIFGARDYSMRIWLDPQKMASRNMTVGDVIAAVQEQNVQVAAGIVGAQPLPKGTTPFQLTVNTEGRLTQPEQFKKIIVKVDPTHPDQVVRLQDVGDVRLGASDYSTSVFFDGNPSVGIGIFQLPGSNALDTAQAVYDKMGELAKFFPPGVDYRIPYDTTLFVKDSIADVKITLLIAVGLVAVVVLVFLQSWRASIVPLLAIPVSLIGTFGAMWLVGFSLNNLSLFGLVLAIGIVVDDAIVVVENVDRWIEAGLPPVQAAYRAMDEVTPAVIAIAFGLTAVFVPVAFVSGITGQFYRQFALTISFSTLLSAFNSLTLSPALAALILKPKATKQDWLTRLLNASLGWFFNLFNKTLSAANAGYVKALRHVVRLSAIALIVYAGLIALTYFGFKSVPTGFIPQQDQGYLICALFLPDAASIDRTDAVITRMAAIAKTVPGIQDTFAVTGLNILTGTNQTNTAAVFTPLASFHERVRHPEQSADNLVKTLNKDFSSIEEGRIFVVSPPPVRGIGFAGGFKMQVEDRAANGGPRQLEKVTNDLITAAVTAKGSIISPYTATSFRSSVPQLYAKVDRTKAKQQNVAITDIFQTLQVYLGSYYINDFNYLGRTYRVVAEADAPFRARASSISQLKTRNSDGDMVPLGSVLDVKDTSGPDRINRYQLYLSAEISGSALPGISTGQTIQYMSDLADRTLPPGYTYDWTELAYQEKVAGNTAIYIFPLCVLFVFLTHSAEYESFALSSAIILIVPMCLLCGIAGVKFSGGDNNIFTQIGFVVLAGMSVKNAVLIVEFAKQQQEHFNLKASAAAIEAARLRLRPILMTSFAFIFGVLPLLTATGAGFEMRRALGTVVFYGMLGVTFFGLFLTPVFYTVIRKLTGRTTLPPDELHLKPIDEETMPRHG